MAATFSVPARRFRSCLPPVRIAVTRVPRLIQSAPAPFGPLNLCAESDSRSAPSARTSTGILRDRLHGVGVEERAARVRDPRQVGHRLHGADLVVGVHHRDERRLVGQRRLERLRRDDAARVDGEEGRRPATAARGP